MDKKKPMQWWEEYLGFSFERFQRNNTWKTGFAYFGYSTAIPLALAVVPMIGPVRPLDVMPHVPVQNQGTELVAVVILKQASAGARLEPYFVFRGPDGICQEVKCQQWPDHLS